MDRVVNAMWRLKRSERAETALFYWRMQGLKVIRHAEQARSYEVTFPTVSFPPNITDKAAHTEASEALERAKRERDRDEVLVGCVLGSEAGKLARYERGLERSLFRTLDELRQLQDRRRNRPLPPIFDAVTLAAGDTE